MSHSYVIYKNPTSVIQLGKSNNITEQTFLNQTKETHFITSTQTNISVVLIAVALLGLFFIIIVFKKKV